MIATGLTFLFGVLVTTLFAILIAPLVWRKAQSLARRDYNATIPASANEIRAEFDRVRAEAALSVRRQEILAAKANEKSARTQAELGRGTVENVELLRRVRGLDQTIAERDAELARLTAELADTVSAGEQLAADLAAARHDATITAEELEALATRFQDLGEIAEERKIQLIAAEAKLDRFADSTRATERSQREAQAAQDRLQAELAAANRTLVQEREANAERGGKLDAMVAELADRDAEITGLKERLAGSIPMVGAASGKRLIVPAPAAALLNPDPAGKPESAGQRLRAAIDRKNGGTDVAAAPDLRDTISDLAARVIRMSALAEGPNSPLAGLLGEAGTASAPPSLADRVRRLAEAEKNAAAQPAETRPE